MIKNGQCLSQSSTQDSWIKSQMAYYDRIANKWHSATGFKGGAFKKLVLNDLLLEKIPNIVNRRILELGAGNGYFLPLVMRRFSGQMPSEIVITDQSKQQLNIAQRHFKIAQANYKILDVRRKFPFDNDTFDLILVTMVFNEISTGGVKKALSECRRVLSNDGVLLITVTHPTFIENLSKRGILRRSKAGMLTMPGSGELRLPVFKRSVDQYTTLLTKSGFDFEADDVFATEQVLNAKPGLRNVAGIPLALVFKCVKSTDR
jgi:ubiquinone/menaquinone biosynthesis C-methylase UbiE